MSLLISVDAFMLCNSHDNLRAYAWTLQLAGGLGVLLLLAGFWCAVEQPLSRRRQELKHEVAQSLELIQSASAVRQRHQTLKAELDNLDDTIRQLGARTAAVHASGLFEQFAELSKRVGATVHDFRPGQVHRTGPLDEHRLQLVMSGDYPALCQFLAGLEDLPLLCHVAQLKLVHGGAAGAAVNLECSLRCYTSAHIAHGSMRTASK